MFSLILQLLTFGLLVLGLFGLRHRVGLTLLFVYVGALQILQTILSRTVGMEILGLPVSPGSAVLFSSSLMALLLVYIRIGVPAARKLIYGIIGANLILALLAVVVRLGISAGWLLDQGGALTLLDQFSISDFLVGTTLLLFDTFLLLMIYESARLLLPGRSKPLAPIVALTMGLLIDGLSIAGIWFSGLENGRELTQGHLLGKLLAGLVFGGLLTLSLRGRLDESGNRIGVVHHQGSDIFEIFRYRERLDRLKDEFERREIESTA